VTVRASGLTLALLVVACLASARDDVPPEIAARENPVVLDEDEVRYYARQFKGKCSRCHGKDGKGGGPEAAEQALPPRDLTDAAYMNTRTDGQLFYQILVGGSGESTMPGMVAFVRRFSAGSD
jgi:mono/diheme cytochrome c family protein